MNISMHLLSAKTQLLLHPDHDSCVKMSYLVAFDVKTILLYNYSPFQVQIIQYRGLNDRATRRVVTTGCPAVAICSLRTWACIISMSLQYFTVNVKIIVFNMCNHKYGFNLHCTLVSTHIKNISFYNFI